MIKFLLTSTFVCAFFITSGQNQKIKKNLEQILKDPTGKALTFLLDDKDSARVYLESPVARAAVNAFLAQFPKDHEQTLLTKIILGNHYVYHLHPDSSIATLQECIDISTKYFPQHYGRALFSLATTYAILQNGAVAMPLFKKALVELEKVGDHKTILSLYNNMGAVAERQGMFEESLKYQLIYLNMVDSTGDAKLKPNAYMNLGETYRNLKKYDLAIKYFQLGLDAAKEVKDYFAMAGLHNNLGIVNNEIEAFDKAIEELSRAMKAATISNNELIKPKIYLNWSQALYGKGDFKTAIEYFAKTDSLAETLGLEIAYYYTNFGRAALYNETKEYDKAISALEKAKIYSPGIMEDLDLLGLMGEVYEKSGQYKLALERLKEYWKNHDSINQNINDEKYNALLLAYDTERTALENNELKMQNLQFETENKLKNLGLLGLVLIILIVFTFLYFVVMSKRNIEKLNETLAHKNVEIVNQNKMLTERDDLNKRLIKILSHDMRGPLVNLNSLLELTEDETLTKEESAQLMKQLHEDVLKTELLLFNVVAWIKAQSAQGLALKLGPVKVYQEVNIVADLNATPLKAKAISLINRIPTQLEIESDLQLLQLIFRNLISNAIKFSPVNSVIEIISDPQEHEESIAIGIRDQGRGMTIQEQETILNGHLSQIGTKGELGTGIGIQIIKEALEKLQGKFWIDSTPGLGSTFWFSVKAVRNQMTIEGKA